MTSVSYVYDMHAKAIPCRYSSSTQRLNSQYQNSKVLWSTENESGMATGVISNFKAVRTCAGF